MSKLDPRELPETPKEKLAFNLLIDGILEDWDRIRSTTERLADPWPVHIRMKDPEGASTRYTQVASGPKRFVAHFARAPQLLATEMRENLAAALGLSVQIELL